jgi:hypothetical protein
MSHWFCKWKVAQKMIKWIKRQQAGNSQAPREDHVSKIGLGPCLSPAHSPHGQRCSQEFHLHLTIFEPRQDQLLPNHPVTHSSINTLIFLLRLHTYGRVVTRSDWLDYSADPKYMTEHLHPPSFWRHFPFQQLQSGLKQKQNMTWK